MAKPLGRKIKKSKDRGAGFSDLKSRIVPVGEVPRYLTMLVYGKGGQGKTAFSSTWPKPALLLDVLEKGTETISKVKGIDVFSCLTWEDLEEVYWMLESGDHKYKTVIIDQITALQGLIMAQIRKEKNMSDDDTFTKRDWGKISGKMQTWLLNYRDLWDKGLNVCFIAHERTNEAEDADDDQIDPNIGPRVMPSVSSFITGAVSAIGNSFIRERYEGVGPKRKRRVEHCMRIGPHANYAAKIRKPPDGEPVPDVIVNPTFEKIMAISRGEGVTRKITKKVRK